MIRHPDLHTTRIMAETGSVNNMIVNNVINVIGRQNSKNSERQSLLKVLFGHANHRRGGWKAEQEGILVDFPYYHVITAP